MTDDAANEGDAASDAPVGPPDEIARSRREIEDLRSSRRRLVLAAEADRRAFEGALHDGVQQYLVAFAVELRHLAGLIDSDPVAARALLDTMTTDTRIAMAETTAVAERIYPPLLSARGLAGPIRSAAERLGITIVIDAPASAGHPSEITTAIYWSCVDVLSFASRGSQATVSVVDADGVLRFSIAIDGDPAAGLTGVQDRIEALDGRVIIDELSGGGRVFRAGSPGLDRRHHSRTDTG